VSPADDFLGRGWAFPVAVGADGDAVSAAGAEDVRQAVRLILETEPGERVMRPDFGAGLRSLLFEPITTETTALVRHRVEQGLTAWEPRIDLVSVDVAVADRAVGRLDVTVRYVVRATNTFYNLVYPFYLQEGAA
jgi:phage baseplate assembly protein W